MSKAVFTTDEDQTRDVNDCTIVGIIDRFDK